MRNFDDPTDIEIQPLIDFHQPLEIIINNEERKIGDGEIIIRTNPKYCLTDEEKVSKREMWKIILEHRVTELGEQTVYNEIMKNAKNGSIILCHDLHSTTVDAMEMVIPKLIDEGYQLVTVSELLSYSNSKLEAGKVYNKK